MELQRPQKRFAPRENLDQRDRQDIDVDEPSAACGVRNAFALMIPPCSDCVSRPAAFPRYRAIRYSIASVFRVKIDLSWLVRVEIEHSVVKRGG